ncbi:MAG: Lrp/AsnC family transcriptional regulator [Candidatus Diapherotrites archaeon]|nr:Lrp/AsnC family transcriptional regulator [Candidatus Diapherotrites archaeon]
MDFSEREIRLLRFLVLNGAQHSISHIGKELRLSPQTVAYEIKQLENKGAIMGYRYRVNPYKLGLKYSAWCTLRTRLSPGFEEIPNKILSNPHIFSVLNLAGRFDMVAKVFYSEPEEIINLIEWFGINFKDEISQVSVIPVVQVNKLHQVPSPATEEAHLDDVSLAILNYKLSNPAASLKVVSEMLGIHRNTVSRKWRKMWLEGVLLKKSVVVQPEVYNTIGFGLVSCILINTAPGKQKRIARNLASMGYVHELFSLASNYDLLALVRNKNVSECYRNIKGIYKEGDVVRTQTLVVLDSMEKQTPYLPIH